jgi:hypothetical protein
MHVIVILLCSSLPLQLCFQRGNRILSQARKVIHSFECVHLCKLPFVFAELWATPWHHVLTSTENFSKILSLCVSYFTSVYVMKWKGFFPNKKLKEPPYFDARAVSYPNLKTIRDYLAWRQVDCKLLKLQPKFSCIANETYLYSAIFRTDFL